MSNAALDTNVLIYLFSNDAPFKRQKVDELLLHSPYIPAQVVSEFLNVSKRLLALPKRDILNKCRQVIAHCMIVPTTHQTLQQAEMLIDKYDLQLFDAIVTAAALDAHCEILYTEDMHHGLLIENTLRIINPFI